MFRTLMNAKIHRARVTEANLNYVGSITIDEDILDAVGMVPNEKVQIVNNNNGARFETYIIPGERGSGVFCLNGAAARLVQKTMSLSSFHMCSYQKKKSLHTVRKSRLWTSIIALKSLLFKSRRRPFYNGSHAASFCLLYM